MKKLKRFFETPKKAAISIACIAAALAVLGTGSVFATAAIAESSSIGEENAKKFAFADAGIDPLAAAAVRTEFDFDHGQFVYEVEFVAEGTEYEYQIKASDGSVVKKEMDLISPRENTTNAETVTKDNMTQEGKSNEPIAAQGEQNPESSGQIDLETAKKTALSDAGLSDSEVTFIKEKFDYEDGVPVYELEFYTTAQEYDYEINALTNTIRSKEAEAHRVDGGDNSYNTQSTNSDIGVEQAKEIAVKHAGLSASDVVFSKAKLDKEDGIMVYEIEFYKNEIEYEYEIHAATGEIVKYDSEHKD